MATFLVTGGAGFIGSHLVDRLLGKHHHVIVLDDLSTGKTDNLTNQAEFIKGDINDQDLILDLLNRVDGCFHLAALVGITLCKEEWLHTHHVNQTGTINIFNSAATLLRKYQKKIPIVFPSSCAVYGDSKDLPYTEDSLPAPISAYGADKLACEFQAKVATYVHGVPTIGLRLFNVYGKRQNPKSPYSGVISIFLDRIKQDLPVDVFGDGNQTRDFIEVSDVVNFFDYFMENSHLSPNIFNVCTGKANTLNHLIEILEQVTKKSIHANYLPPRAGDTLYSCGDPTKSAQFLTAKMDLKQGLFNLLS